MQDGVPEKLAYAIASSSVRLSLLDIIQVSLEVDFPIETVSAAYFSVSDILDLSWFRRQLTEYEALSRWDLLARAAYQDALDRYHRILTLEVLRSREGRMLGRVAIVLLSSVGMRFWPPSKRRPQAN